MKKNDRLQALQLLIKLFQDGVPLTQGMHTQTALSAFSKEIAFGVCRHYYRLICLADALLEKRPKSLEVWLIVLMGLYQLQFMQKPAYATVQETVALLQAVNKNWAKGLVNAVLRRFCREQADLLSACQEQAAFQFGHPSWFIERVQQAWPDHWQAILQANDAHPPFSLRVNQRRQSRDDYLARLQAATIAAKPHQYAPMGIRLQTPCDVTELPGFLQGDVSVQDESAQLAIGLLRLQPGLRVLDACCAPGGKTGYILESQPDLAACVALDVDGKRLQRVQDNLSRLQLTATCVQGDGQHPGTWWDGQRFDRILLDAPCSATGVIRRHPDIKCLRQPEDIAAVCVTQQALLQSLWPLLSEGGLLVYATCSIMPEENEQQIKGFLANHPDAVALKPAIDWAHWTGHGWQVLPGEADRDGFFYSILQKSAGGQHG